MQTNFHGHQSRCRKGSVGKVKCPQPKPSPRSMATVWDEVKLVPKLYEDDQILPKSAWDAEACASISPAPPLRPSRGKPLPEPDERVVCLTLHRPLEGDVMVVEYHNLISGFLGCNTANLKTGTAADTKAVLYYQVKYLSKNPCDLIESLSLLLAARKIALRFGGPLQRMQVH